MKVSELIAILSECDPDAIVRCHDGEYEDTWQIEDVYTTKSGIVKISPFPDDHLDNPDSPQQSQSSIVKHAIAHAIIGTGMDYIAVV